MTKPHVLVVEDNVEIHERIGETLFSMGFSYEFTTNQQDTIRIVKKKQVDLMLLDLQIPARPYGMTDVDSGRNCLEQVRRIKNKKELPVVIMTAHLGPGLELMRDLIPFDPNHFIPKPFPPTGKTLPVVIREAMAGNDRDLKNDPKTPKPATKFTGGVLTLYADRAELMGVEMLSSRARLSLAIMRILAQKRPDGRYRTFSSQQLTDRLKQEFAELNISGAIQNLRAVFVSKLKESNIDCGREDVILHAKNGYVLNEQVAAEFVDICPEVPNADVPNVPKNVPSSGQNVPGVHVADKNVQENVPDKLERIQDRQNYVLSQISTGKKLSIAKIAQALDCSEKTVRRDLTKLIEQGRIAEVHKGCYKRLESAI